MSDRKLQSIVGCLLGTAVGEALGLPYQGLSRNKIYKFATPIRGHSFIFNKGMISTNTEHTCMVAQSLIVSGGDEAKFTHSLAWRLRFSLLGLPGGISLATLKSILKLWQFSSSDAPKRAGKAHRGINSADNKAAARSAIIGVCYGDNQEKLCSLVKASTLITHNNSKAELGAIAVAVAAYLASRQAWVSPQDYYQTLQNYLSTRSAKSLEIETAAFLSIIQQACLSAEKKETGVAFANKSANQTGVSSYVYDSIPLVLQIWLRYQDSYSNGVREIIYLGGNTDTTAAILGGIIGSAVGQAGISKKWLDNILDFPRSLNWIESLGERLAKTCEEDITQPALFLAFYLISLRNFLFWAVILFHLFYRLIPPY
jgi:ADP-ribosyl-[dinitrogen reductase] hydrolase